MERRTSPRHRIIYPIWVIYLDDQDDQENQFEACALDINQSGMLIESTTPLRGQKIKVLASTGKQKVIEIVGSIVYTDHSVIGKFKAGMQFIGSEHENRIFSEKLIEAYRSLVAEVKHVGDAPVPGALRESQRREHSTRCYHLS